MNAFDLPRRRSGRRTHLVAVPHQPATAGFSDPAPVFTDRRLAAIEQDLAWLRRVLERLAGDDPEAVGLDPGSHDHPAWISEPGAPAWTDAPAAGAGQSYPAADMTMPDQRARRARPYVPQPAAAPVPVVTDLEKSGGHGGCPVFRDVVRGQFVRSEPHHGCPQQDVIRLASDLNWPVRFAVLYQHRTSAVPEPDLGIDELFGPRAAAGGAR